MCFIALASHRRCLAHIINLATQALISTRSKAKYYNPHNVDEHTLDTDAWERDELGLVRAISVKERSSSQRKELFRTLQTRKGIDQPVQLLIDMKVRWGSTYVMLNRANSNKKVIAFYQFMHCSWIMLMPLSLSMNLFTNLVFVLRASKRAKNWMP
jgi:hypothetical protein